MINTPQAPYFDDFNVEKNFLKILFKPKLSVQTRELEQLQSMFQHQVETLASQIFKNGSVVSGGKFNFKEKVNYVKLYNEYNGQIFNYEIYKNRYVYGNTTKILARVFEGWSQSTNEVASLYLDYLTSGENQEQTFQPGEVIQIVSKLYLGTISGDINVGDTLQSADSSTGSGAIATIVNIDNNEYEVVYSTDVAFQVNEEIIDTNTSGHFICTAGESNIYKAQIKTNGDDENAVGFGSAVYVDEGIYYIDGYFVHTNNQVKIISEYSSTTNARVGFEKEVKIITSAEDSSLLDNANCYPNQNAPGADRLKIELVLDYYNLFKTPSENFIEIITIEDSVVTGNSSINQKYSDILDTMARRTYDESGNYTVNPFRIDIQEFLDNGENNGVYKAEHFGYNTQQEALNASMKVFGVEKPGSSHIYGTKYYPYNSHQEYLNECENRLALGIESGKAYVMGYEIDHTSKEWIPLIKARDTKKITNSSINVFYGNYIKVKDIKGIPNIYNHQLVNLQEETTYGDENTPIGTARVYAIEVDSGTPGDENCIYRLYLDTIQIEENKDFSIDVNSIGTTIIPGSAAYNQKFTCKTVKTNGNNTLYNIGATPLIFPLEKEYISKIEDSSYNYKKAFSGVIASTTGGAGTFTIPTDVYARFVDISDPRNYLVVITSGALEGTIINNSTISLSTDTSGNLTFSGLPSSTIDCGYFVLATLHKQVNNIKTKTLYSNVEFVKAEGPFDEIILDHCDGYRLVGIYESADSSTIPTTSDTNITDNFTFDNGQHDTYYDLARVKLKDGIASPSGQVLVVYDYFSHSSGDYFTVDSYEGQVEYQDIPTYSSSTGKEFSLRDCIDLRGKVDENGSGNFSSSSLPYIMQNNSIFESNISYYLPRLDLLELDYKGNFSVKYGTSSEDPQYPIGSINSMTLYYLGMPSYTEHPEDVVQIYVENKRYTMRDIGNLDSRLTAVENYVLLSGSEVDANNIAIYDLEGYQCIKTGFVVDSFTSHIVGDTNIAGYKCSMDSIKGALRPDYKLNTIELVKSTTRSSTVIESNGVYMIPYTAKEYISNTVNTSYIALNNNQLIEWRGNVVLGRTLSTTFNDDGLTNINTGVPMTYTDNTKIYNVYKSSWLGINNTILE